MSVKFKINTRRFNRSFAAYVRECKAELWQIVNTKAFFIARWAIQFTRRTPKSEIEALGVTYRTQSKTGKALKRAKATYKPNIRFRAIYTANLRKSGIDPNSISAGDFEKKMKRALSARMQARGFLASGWIPAVKRLAGIVRKSIGPIVDARQRGQAKGGVIPASETWRPVCVIENTAGYGTSGDGDPSRVLSQGLQLAFDREAASMEQYVIERLNKAGNKDRM